MDKVKSYHVCIFAAENNPHAACFLEVALLLKYSLISLGFSCSIAVNRFSTDSINIFIGSNILRSAIPGVRYIIYQLEQISDKEWVHSDSQKMLLEKADAIWDYSPQNIAFLKSQGIEARYLPAGYHAALEQVHMSAEKDIDILFYGSKNRRREDVLNRILKDRKYKLQYIYGLYGKERDALIARAKIVLNLHFYAAGLFECVRVSYLLNNRCFVVSEESPAYPYQGVDIPLAPYETIVDTCYRYLEHPEEMQNKSERAYTQFKTKYPMSELLKKVL